MECSYRLCDSKGKALLSVDDHVEVKTVLPKAGLKKLPATKLWINWKPNGEAILHTRCWTKCVEAARMNRRGSRRKPLAEPVLLRCEVSFIREAEKTVEYFDSRTRVQAEASRVANMIRESKHAVVFTGAGISTSAGIGDYRGKSGKWTKMDQEAVDMEAKVEEDLEAKQTQDEAPPSKKARLGAAEDSDKESSTEKKKNEEEEEEEEEEDEGVPYESLRPTLTHEALQKLMELGLVKYIISQNGDGLHTLSGIPEDKMSELHGNVFVETCEKCSARYDRDFYVMDDVASAYYEELEENGETTIIKPHHAKQCARCGLSHRTGRRCDKKGCGGHLMDSIINFRDLLEESVLDRAKHHARSSDLMICLGSTLTVTPANSLVNMTQKPKRIIIVNRQETDYDHLCKKCDKAGQPLGSRVFGDCDVFMEEVMRALLGQEESDAWKKGRPARMEVYNSKRSAPAASGE